MASSEMLRRVALVRTDVSEELNASIIRVTRIGELGATLAVTSNRRTLQRHTSYSETSVLTRTTWRNIPEGAISR
jgi:demethoxyubiquinone hydroxylase (CLK1/Coq7/Cat5 family)